MNNKSLKYFCKTCKIVKSAKFVIVFPEDSNGNRDKGKEIEVFVTFPAQKITQADGSIKEKKEFKGRQLECNHFVHKDVPGFTEINSENLNQFETAEIRRLIDKEMIGKTLKDYEQAVLFQAEQYQTLLKIASKQKLQAKYAIQYIDQLRERYSATLQNEDEKISFETKFAHFLDLKPTTQKTIERERTSVERAADKQKNSIKSAEDAIKALFAKTGYDPKELFKKKPESETTDNQ